MRKWTTFLSLEPEYFGSIEAEQQREIRIVQMLLGIAEAGGQNDIKDKIQRDFEGLFESFKRDSGNNR